MVVAVQMHEFLNSIFISHYSTHYTVTYPTFIVIFTCAGAPQVMVVTPVNSTTSTVTVSWSEIQCFDGSETVTHYLVQYWSICGGAVRNVTTGGIVQTFSGLRPNYVYTLRVAAVGASQKIGPFSNPASTVPHCADEPGSSCDSGLDELQSSSIASLAAGECGR